MKHDPTQEALEALSALRSEADHEILLASLRSYLASRSNQIVARAARIARERGVGELVPDLVQGFHRFMKDPKRLDKGCAALSEVARALYELDYREPDIYTTGIRHVQMEGSFGPPVDIAAPLRGTCALGLARTNDPQALAEVVSLLGDKEAPARLGAVRALATNGGAAGALVLRFKALTGDADPEITAECFSALLNCERDHALDFVISFVDSPDPEVNDAAILALGASRLPQAIEYLKQKWEQTLGDPRRKTILLALATSRDEAAVNFLVSLIDSAGLSTASEVIAALAAHKHSERIRQAVSAAVDRRRERPLLDIFRREFSD